MVLEIASDENYELNKNLEKLDPKRNEHFLQKQNS